MKLSNKFSKVKRKSPKNLLASCDFCILNINRRAHNTHSVILSRSLFTFCHPLSRHRANENIESKLSPVHIFRRDKKKISRTQNNAIRKKKLDWVLSAGFPLNHVSRLLSVFHCCSCNNNRMRSPFGFRPWSSRAWKHKRDIVKLRNAAQRFSYIERTEHFLSSVLRRTSTDQQQKKNRLLANFSSSYILCRPNRRGTS